MKIVSWNVQGLGGHRYKQLKQKIHLDLQNVMLESPIDVLLLQQYHLNGERIVGYGSVPQGNWTTYWSARIGTYGSNGGVCISVNDKWKEEIIHYVEVVFGRAQYVIFKIKQMQFGCLNIYAPNQTNERVEFWSYLYDVFLDNWCVAGDFNVIGYLGCQVGINLSFELHIVPLVNCIRRKLLFWSSKSLSFACRIVITSQVLLSTMWYVTSCCIFVKSSIG